VRVDQLRDCVRKIKKIEHHDLRRDLRVRTLMHTIADHERRLRRIEQQRQHHDDLQKVSN
jgi:hypothetical protein